MNKICSFYIFKHIGAYFLSAQEIVKIYRSQAAVGIMNIVISYFVAEAGK